MKARPSFRIADLADRIAEMRAAAYRKHIEGRPPSEQAQLAPWDDQGVRAYYRGRPETTSDAIKAYLDEEAGFPLEELPKP